MDRKQLNNDGSALITVIVVMAVIILLTMSLSMLFSGNLKQIIQQERRIQGHYLALSGIEMAYNALMTEDVHGKKLYEELKWDRDMYPDIYDDLNAKLNSFDFPLKDTIEIDGNSVLISISPINTNGEREIKIHSLATLSGSGTTHSLVLIFNSENVKERRWE